MRGTAFLSLRMGGTLAWLLRQPIEQFSVISAEEIMLSVLSWIILFSVVHCLCWLLQAFTLHKWRENFTSQSPLSLSQTPFRVLLPSSVCHESWTASQDDILSLRTRTGTFVTLHPNSTVPGPTCSFEQTKGQRTEGLIIQRYRIVGTTP